MMRRNFARMSGVLLDTCGNHGSYFDPGELEDVLAFVQTGGLAAARAHTQRRRRREAEKRANESVFTPGLPGAPLGGELEDAIPLVAFIRWAWGWLRRSVRSDE